MDKRKSGYWKAVRKWRRVSWLLPAVMIVGVIAGLASEKWRTICLIAAVTAWLLHGKLMRPKPSLRDYPADFAYYESVWEPEPEPGQGSGPEPRGRGHECDCADNPYDIRDCMR